MNRNAQKQLSVWFKTIKRKPLILRGARQVGKSTLVRLFAQESGLTLFEINLERHLYLIDAFRSGNMTRIMGEIQGLVGEIRSREQSILFLDEIQAIPEAVQALRYFYDDMKDLAVIAAGSLLEFTLANHSFSMPVGRVTYLHLGPLSFDEFLEATDKELFHFYSSWKWLDPLPESRHNKLLLRQREFMMIGGMPEAVQVWIDSALFGEVQDVHRSILDTYIDDFSKYARQAQLVRLQRILRALPRHICRKVKYSSLSRDDRAAEVRGAIDLLCKARVCTAVHHTVCSGLPLGAEMDDSTFKLLFLDIGLISFQLGISWTQLQSMDERTLINEGVLAEQFIGQELLYRNHGKEAPELFYWLREGRSNNAELDFVIVDNSEILPIEVKAGKTGTMKSLFQFIEHKKTKRAIRFDLNPPSSQQLLAGDNSCSLISLPLYMVGRLAEILESGV